MESELQNPNPNPNPPKQPDPIRNDDGPLLTSDDLHKKFAAFSRHDVYGAMGRGDLPTREKLLLGVALVTLVPVRLVATTAIVVLYYAICRICTMCSVPNRKEEQEDYTNVIGWRRIVIVRCGKALSRLMLFVLGFYSITHSYRFPRIHIDNTTTTTTMQVLPSLIHSIHSICMHACSFIHAIH